LNPVVLISVLALGITAAVAGIALYVISRTFHVVEDARVDEIENLLPGINCGACGYPGCRGCAEAIITAADDGDITGFFCPPGGNEVMGKIARKLGYQAQRQMPTTAVLLCNGGMDKAPVKYRYRGPEKCFISHELFLGPAGCAYGCLGYGDCVQACDFDAIKIDPKTGLPVILEDHCVSCGACVKACPRNLIVILPRGGQNQRVWVACQNREKGAIAIKNCKAACIACNKCVKICDQIAQAVSIQNNVAVIDQERCTRCGTCVGECPTGAILANFSLFEELGEPALKDGGKQ